MIDRVRQLLSGWKAAQLSMAGRATLIRTVTSTIPAYAMQTSKLPSSVCDRLNKRFLWGGDASKRRMHLVAWDTVCTPPEGGSLNCRRMEHLNLALLAKTGWRALHEKDKLWSGVLHSKYMRHQEPIWESVTANGSHVWRSLRRAGDLIQQGMGWKIGNGQTVKF